MTATYLGRLRCPRCGTTQPESAAPHGCPQCTVAVNLVPEFAIAKGSLREVAEPGLFRYRPLLPLPASAAVVSLGEGGTPLVPLRRLGPGLGLHRLLYKDESRNPTWSYKDRLAAVAVSQAAAAGADTVIVSTTGNHGAAVAAYAAAAGLRCVALTLTSVPTTMLTLMQSYGAKVVAYEHGPDRWAVMAQAVAAHGWAPMSGMRNPPMGSNTFGVLGYKTIAYELWQDLGAVPDVVVVPAAYGDGLSGLAQGFADLVQLGLTARVPRLVGVDPFGAYRAALVAADDQPRPILAGSSVAFSVATPIATYQGVAAITASKGTAVGGVGDDEVMVMQARLGAAEGLYAEPSSVLPLVAAARLAEEGWFGAEDTVVVLGTSTGLKDVGATAARLPIPPVLEPRLSTLDKALGHASDRAVGG